MRQTGHVSLIGIFIFVGALISLPVLNLQAKEQPNSQDELTTCKSGSEVRTIDIQNTSGGGCNVIYTRDGAAKQVGHADHQHSICVKVAEKIRSKIEASGFQCDDSEKSQ